MSGDVNVLDTTVGFMRLRWLITPGAALCTHGFYTNSALMGGFNQNERITNMFEDRCAVAHEEDTRDCVGEIDGVIVADQDGAKSHGCVLHAAVALKSLQKGRIQAGEEPGAATAAFRLASEIEPFAWRSERDRERAAALYRWHVRVQEDGQRLCWHDDFDGQGSHWVERGEKCLVADAEVGKLKDKETK